jgi:hypothetical protein
MELSGRSRRGSAAWLCAQVAGGLDGRNGRARLLHSPATPHPLALFNTHCSIRACLGGGVFLWRGYCACMSPSLTNWSSVDQPQLHTLHIGAPGPANGGRQRSSHARAQLVCVAMPARMCLECKCGADPPNQQGYCRHVGHAYIP